MPTNPADDFRIFEGTEHMFFGLPDPFAVIREETEAGLKRQVADTELISIVAHGEPKFIATGAQSPDGTMHATDFGFCFRATMTVAFNQGRSEEVLEAALTFLFGGLNRREGVRLKTHSDLHAEADRNFREELFEQRFRAFCAEQAKS